MKKILTSSQFRRDFKRIKNQPDKIKALITVVEFLQNEVPLPEKYKLHRPSGNLKNRYECHFLNDLLLMYSDPDNNSITLVRLGSHSELF